MIISQAAEELQLNVFFVLQQQNHIPPQTQLF